MYSCLIFVIVYLFTVYWIAARSYFVPLCYFFMVLLECTVDWIVWYAVIFGCECVCLRLFFTWHTLTIFCTPLSQYHCTHTGKTIEVMTLMVSNPRTDISTGESSSLLGDTTKPGGLKTVKQRSTKAIRDLYVTRATLIVVPSTLVGQWSRELQSRIVYSELPSKKFDVLNVSNRYLKEVLTIPAEDLVSASDGIEVGQSVQFTIPWGPPTKVLLVRTYMCTYARSYDFTTFPSCVYTFPPHHPSYS